MELEWIVDANELAESLCVSFKKGPIIDDVGRRLLTEEIVARLDGLKIEIFSREHPPPHFRVNYAGDTADFTIKDCTKLNGGLAKWERNIRIWHSSNKHKLIETWNRKRPTECPVGNYQE